MPEHEGRDSGAEPPRAGRGEGAAAEPARQDPRAREGPPVYEPPHPIERTLSAVRRSRWPGWIWSIPVTAIGVLIWLGVRFFFSHGETVTVLFDRVTGVSAQATQVTYRGVDVGKVSDVQLTPDGEHAQLTLSIDHSMQKYLRSGTRFWLQGLSPTLSDLSSLTSIISGPTVVMDPGSGRPQRHFIGLSQPPAYQTPTAGTRFTLEASTHGSLQEGAKVYYLGLAVGKVTAVRLTSEHHFQIEVLVQSPYDHLVHPGSRFWDAGALEVSMTHGIQLRLVSLAGLVEGAIAFDTPTSAESTAPSAAGSVFELYPDQTAAQLAPAGPYALFTVRFPGPVGKLSPGAPVKLRNFVVGEVRQVGFDYDAQTGQIASPVTIELDADRLHITGDPPSPSNPVDSIRQAIDRLVRGGLRARLDEEVPMIGPAYVALDLVPGVSPARLDRSEDPPGIPAASAAGLSTLTAQLSQLPVRQIGQNVSAITMRVRNLVSSPRLTDSLKHLDGSLDSIDQILHQAQPQVQPLVVDLRRAAGQLDGVMSAAHTAMGGPDQQGGVTTAMEELSRAARSVRSLADYLDRHPEALIRGKQP